MAGVVLTDVTKRYPGGFQAVDRFNLDIADKEFVVLVGPSGCGKSTTLRMVAGLEEITEGDLFIGERRVNDVHPKDRDIAMVFQSYALYPHMSVFDNMAFGLKLRRINKQEIRSRVEEAARVLDIESLLARKPKALSGGQRQRVAMGRAIVRDPEVFLFDDPLSNLDAKLRVQMRVEISRLHKRLGRTIIYVTHDQVEAMTLADRIVIMDAGVLQQAGTPVEVFHAPVNTFVAGFIGSPAMNFVDGSVEHAGEEVHFTAPGFRIPIRPGLRVLLPASGGVKAGFRPQHLVPAQEVGDQRHVVTGRVEFIEHMGVEKFIHCDVEGIRVVARVEGDAEVEAGTVIRLTVIPESLLLFDEQGRNIATIDNALS